jgi:hypothetical protein
MMNYRLLLFALLLGTAARAQFHMEKRVFKMGVNLVDVQTSPTNALPSRDLKPVFNLGFAGDFRLGRSPFCLRIGGQYQPRGYRYTAEISPGKTLRANASLHYLDLPVDLVLTLGGSTKFFASAGGYVGYALYGRVTQRADGFEFLQRQTVGEKDTVVTATVLRSDAFGSQGLKRLDYGLNGAVGFERNNFQVGVTLGYGLADLSQTNRYGLRNRALGIFLYYRFDDM